MTTHTPEQFEENAANTDSAWPFSIRFLLTDELGCADIPATVKALELPEGRAAVRYLHAIARNVLDENGPINVIRTDDGTPKGSIVGFTFGDPEALRERPLSFKIPQLGPLGITKLYEFARSVTTVRPPKNVGQ